MKKEAFSILGFLLDNLGISYSALAREIHVDVSLVSKWKRGSRNFNKTSVYFSAVVDFIFSESKKEEHKTLKRILSTFFPSKKIEDSENIKKYLIKIFDKELPESLKEDDSLFLGEVEPVHAQIVYGNEGKRQIIENILNLAEHMSQPGSLIFIDREDYSWLLEDKDYAERFVVRLKGLFEKGFRAKFVIHFSSYKNRFVDFFETCNKLLLQRNAEWYYYESYDENILQVSLSILERAVCALEISSCEKEKCHIVLTDSSAVLNFRVIADSIISKCQKLFSVFEKDAFINVLDSVKQIKKKGTLYSYLPAPVFLTTSPELLTDILKSNRVEDELIKKCLTINRILREFIFSQIRDNKVEPARYVQVFQKEEMERRARIQPFLSCSLSVITHSDIKVSKKQYAKCLKDIVSLLENNDNIEVVFFSESDNIPLPHYSDVNFWLKKNTWVIQMDKAGFRSSSEISFVNAASIIFEKSLRKIPPERKNISSAMIILKEFISELEK